MNGFRGIFSHRSGHDRQGWASMNPSHHLVLYDENLSKDQTRMSDGLIKL